jgi:enterochelin esterase-like enzyme
LQGLNLQGAVVPLRHGSFTMRWMNCAGFSIVAMAFAWLSFASYGQQPTPSADPTRPRAAQATEPTSNQPRGGIVSDGGRGGDLASPIVDRDRRVTFRVKAPQATSISLTCDFQDETKLSKGDDGVWSVTVGPIDPDIYYYNFIVDGVRTLDPGNSSAKIGYYTSTLTSVLTVPGSEPAFYDVKDVAHGEIRTNIYRSKSNGVSRELNVYVPPQYDDNPSNRYPVLYLLHGNANDHSSWLRYGRANEILDNLLAEGAIQPFLVVMPLGYGKASINGDGQGVAADSGPDNRSTAAPASATGGPDFYEQDILKDVIPMIDSKYRTIADRHHRAIFGFSMGGGQAGRIGLGNLDVFSSVGIMSAGLGRGGESGIVSTLSKDVAATNDKLDLLWIGCGKDDFAFQGASSSAQSLKAAGIKHTFIQSEGGHHWRVWRRYLHEVAPQLFKTSKQ